MAPAPTEQEPAPLPKRRRYSKVNYPIKKLSFPDLPWVVGESYLPCPHLHCRTWPIQRNYLTPDQQLQLLATPKGYRWYSHSEHLLRRLKNKEPIQKKVPKKPFPGLCQFMFEIWNMLTPEMIIRLKEILEEELDMSPEEAVSFLMRQRDKAMRAARAEVLGPAPHVKGGDIAWARKISGIIADKVTCCTEMTACSPRNRRTVRLEKILRGGLHKAAGLEVEGPRSPTRALLYRLAQLLAVWLNGLPRGAPDMKSYCEQLNPTQEPSLVSLN